MSDGDYDPTIDWPKSDGRSRRSRGSTGYLIPSNDGPARLAPLPSFVRTLGGGYFFMPGRSFLAWLGGL